MTEVNPSDRLTLPGYLAWHAASRPQVVALRHKQLGEWHRWSWADLQLKTQQHAAALHARGFKEGDALLIISRPRVEALILALAAQGLGGTAVPLDVGLPELELQSLIRAIGPRYVFAEDQSQVDHILASRIPLELLIYADGRGLGRYHHPEIHALSALLAEVVAEPEYSVNPDKPAFHFYRTDSDHALVQQVYTHEQLVREAEYVIAQESLTAGEEALAARAFATVGQARYLFAPWLVVGFTLNFPEKLSTRDNDRRELSPTLVLGTRETYGRVAELAERRLPARGSLSRRWLDWALNEERRGPLTWLMTLLVRRSIRRNLGFARLRVPLLVGEILSLEDDRFYLSLGIKVRRWPDAQGWQRLGIRAEPQKPQAPIGLQVSF